MCGLRVGLRHIGPDGLLTLVLSNLLILATAGLSWGWIWLHSLVWLRRLRCTGAADRIWVLGQQLDGGVPTADYRRRLLRAVLLLRRNPQAQVLLLGGTTLAGAPSEAAAGAAFLRARGVAAERILTEDASRHTLENLRNARALLEQGDTGSDVPIALISNRFHLPRAVAMARGMGLSVQPCPAETGVQVAPLRLAREAWMLHWYYVGRGLARLLRHRGMLARIS